MFIIWGHSNSVKKRGVVADQCTLCGRVSVLQVTQHYTYPHLYFIPVGSSKLVMLTCTDCGGNSTTVAEAYVVEVVGEKTGDDH